MRLASALTTLVLCVGVLVNALGDENLPMLSGGRTRRLLQGGLPQQALANIASLAGQLSSLSDQGNAENPLANSAVQLLGAVQAPQSDTYNANLAGSVVEVIGSALSGQPPSPSSASALLEILQAVLGSTSPSLTALVSQGLRQGNILPATSFGPEGNFSNGLEIVQAVAELLPIPQGLLRTLALAPLGALWPPAPAHGPMPQVRDARMFAVPTPAPSPDLITGLYSVLEAGRLPFGLPPLPSGLGASLLEQVQRVLALPLADARSAVASGEADVVGALQNLLTDPSTSGNAPAASLGAVSLTTAARGVTYDNGSSVYPEPAPSFPDPTPYRSALLSPLVAPMIAPKPSPLASPPGPSVAPTGQPPVFSINPDVGGSSSASLTVNPMPATRGGNSSGSLTVDLRTLITEVQRGGLENVVNRTFVEFTSYLSSIGNSFARAPLASTLGAVMKDVPLLFPLPSIVLPKGVTPATIGDPCKKGTMELPYKKGPSCSAKTITLTLVPWSCSLDATHNVLSCSDIFLLYEETPEYCSLRDISEGMLAGRECPLKHKLGLKKDIHLGGQLFKLKATDVLKALLLEVPNP